MKQLLAKLHSLWQVNFLFPILYALALASQLILLKKNYDYRNTWDLIKTTIVVIISKRGQDQNTRMKTRQIKTLAS